ncbi:site-specific DNA-methyltransferase [Thalassospira profundimaris]|uniref:site-specific DNA-methyltransferase n=1 Tax=Thalassospira profundimaris TaxID=502049 RepID=UPI001C68DA6E|nr:site-specific DNA-methyltransferase [Thalassospira profundimaris]
MNKINARSGTFLDNMKLPVHRWFRYSAGFSAQWVEDEIIRFELESGKKAKLLDPFVGSGTACLSACALQRKSIGLEGHPFVARIGQAKNLWHLNSDEFVDSCLEIVDRARNIKPSQIILDNKGLLEKCYETESLQRLFSLRLAYEDLKTESAIWQLSWLNITSILRACSTAGTAQWQYILPKKNKSRVLDPYEAFLAKMDLMASDMKLSQKKGWGKTANIIQYDSRKNFVEKNFNLAITSPPYPNNYDYADSTRLEMTFWGEINGWGDLKHAVRPSIMRSCSQHSASDKINLDEILSNPELSPILAELQPATKELAAIRLTKGGRKTYHTMVAAYFYDLAKIIRNVYASLEKDARACFVIGDSAPYGVHVPAERWLGELALSVGFKRFQFEKIRDRNIKWKNRTHTVPLHEGRLWLIK